MFEALTAVTFWQVWRNESGLARLGAATIFAVSAAASLGRAVSLVPTWHMESGLVQANVYWLLAFIALNILQAGSLMFLINQSLLDELQHMADFDPLTGLLNRRGLSRRMKRQRPRSDTKRSPRMGMLCMDLDHFKAINDMHGHGAGDDVLRAVGQLLRDNSRPRDTAVRQGGEEFGMVVEAGSEEELRTLAERHRAAVERDPFPTRVGPIPVTISIGAALAGNMAESLEEIGERADQSLLVAKRNGRNRVVLASDRSGDQSNPAS
jgi:diguanylate cyclase (GGDEF)-like protein